MVELPHHEWIDCECGLWASTARSTRGRLRLERGTNADHDSRDHPVLCCAPFPSSTLFKLATRLARTQSRVSMRQINRWIPWYWRALRISAPCHHRFSNIRRNGKDLREAVHLREFSVSGARALIRPRRANSWPQTLAISVSQGVWVYNHVRTPEGTSFESVGPER